jgi:hypothetical protein
MLPATSEEEKDGVHLKRAAAPDGFLHALRSGKPSLALDLMEELRSALADRLALRLVNLRELSADNFTIILVYDRGMPVSVNVQTVHPRKLAAVRREVAPGAVGSAWGPAVGKVWDFIRSQPGLWTDGHNIFLYHHSNQPSAPILCDFGVEVTRTFETAGEVYATETREGEAAVAVHSGPYDRMNEAYNAIDKWMAANRRESAGHSWEIYGDPTPDPAHTETTVVHLLK